jgi:protein-disulfide isomerase
MIRLRPLLFLSLLSLPVFAVPYDGAEILLEINGTRISASQFETRRPAALFQARNNFYQAERKALEDFIDDTLIESQAKQENLTVAQLLDKHVKNKIAPDPSEESLKVFYEGAETTQPYEAVREQIIAQIRTSRTNKAKAAYLASLRKQANIVIRLAAPRAAVSLENTPLRGAASAPVKIVEFADYECPYCQQIQPVLERLEAEYKGKVVFAYKDVPLPMHSRAQKAAEATHCAAVQGKYWEYHDLLFADRQLEVPQLKEAARKLKLNGEVFDKCLDTGEQSEIVKSQLAEGQAFQLQGTPTFFINGRLFSGMFTLEQFRAVIDEELSAASPVASH